jgi:hypothetical protein
MLARLIAGGNKVQSASSSLRQPKSSQLTAYCRFCWAATGLFVQKKLPISACWSLTHASSPCRCHTFNVRSHKGFAAPADILQKALVTLSGFLGVTQKPRCKCDRQYKRYLSLHEQACSLSLHCRRRGSRFAQLICGGEGQRQSDCVGKLWPFVATVCHKLISNDVCLAFVASEWPFAYKRRLWICAAL